MSWNYDWFREWEFNHPDKMDATFLAWLDEIRGFTGVAIYPTSDYRSPAHNAAVGGSPWSLHKELPCACIDFATFYTRKRDKRQHKRERWLLHEAIVMIPRPSDRQVSLEWVEGPTDWHVHLGLYPLGDPRRSNVALALD